MAAVSALMVLAGGAGLDLSLRAEMHATIGDSLRRAARRLESEVAAHRIDLAGVRHRAVPATAQSTEQIILADGAVGYTTTLAGPSSLLSRSQTEEASHRPLIVQRSRRRWSNPYLLLAEPAPGTPGAVLVVGRSLDELENAVGRLQLVLLVGGPLIVVAVAAGAWTLAGLALRPIDRLRAEAALIARESPGRRLAEPRTRDEVERLSVTFNDLLDRLHGALDRQRRFVADASHELRTPLAAVQAELETAHQPARSEADLRRSLGVIGSRVAQLVRMSDDLLLLARGDEGVLHLDTRVQEVEPVIAASLQTLRRVAAARGVDLVLDAEPAVRAPIDGERIQQVVDNLVANAVEHSCSGSVVEVRVSHAAGGAAVEVRDRGSGFPEEFLPVAFERFATADDACNRGGGGVGLGLAVVAAIVGGHGGNVAARNRRRGGASVLVTLPGGQPPAGPGGRIV